MGWRQFLAVFCLCLVPALAPIPVEGRSPSAGLGTWFEPAGKQARRTVFLAGNLKDDEIIALTSTFHASGHPGVLLLDSERSQRYNRIFLREFGAGRVVPVGSFPGGREDLKELLGVETTPIQHWPTQPGEHLWKRLFPRAQTMVVSPDRPRRLLLQAACLAGVLHAPLFISRGRAGDSADLHKACQSWPIREIHAVGGTHALCSRLPGIQVHQLKDEEAVCGAHRKTCLDRGPIRTLVVANPADGRFGPGPVSLLAPWIALQKRALLVLTNDAGTNVEEAVTHVLEKLPGPTVDHVILAGNPRAIPMQQRPNPCKGKDITIAVEPLTPAGSGMCSYALGRLFHDDLNVLALTLARQRLRPAQNSPGKALVISNPGGGLPLLETFSRQTAREFQNAGFQTTALFNRDVERDKIRSLLPDQRIFLWEGHHSTFARDYEIPEWTEPLQPSLVFLQSCLALTEDEALPFLRRGALGVVGTPNRTYSGSGGAFSLAYFDALIHDRQTLGGALRQAKNFLLAFSLLKEKRLGAKSRLGGASVRTAWAFTLWGDPTVTLPAPPRRDNPSPRVWHQVRGHTIHLLLPDTKSQVSSSKKKNRATAQPAGEIRYQADTWPNGRLAGLWRSDDDGRKLVPLVFVEVQLPKSGDGKTPRLTSRLPGKNWVFCWDARQGRGYLLALPRARDEKEIRFHVHWE